MPLILPEETTERDAIEAAAQQLLAKADVRVPAMRRHVADVLHAAVADIPLDRLNRGIEANDWTLIRESIPTLTPEPYVPMAKARTPEEAIDGLIENLEAISRNAATFGASIVPRFDLVDQHAVDFARTRAGRLLRDFDANAINSARAAVAYGIENGRTVEQTSRFLRSTLYIPPRGRDAVQHYFDDLIARVEQGDDIQEAARSAGRGRALAPKQFLDAKNIDTLTDRYAARWIAYTAESTARTMTIEASNAGLRAGWEQAADAGFFDKATARIVWYATNDDMVCPECSMLNGTTIAFDGQFDTSGGTTPYPPAHPSCRCTTVLVTDLRDVPRVQRQATGSVASQPGKPTKPGIEKVLAGFRDANPSFTFDIGHTGDYISIRQIGNTKDIADALKEISAYADASQTTVTFDRDILDPLTIARRRELRAAAREYGFVSNNTGKVMDTPDLLVRVAGKKPKPIKPKEPKVTKPKVEKPSKVNVKEAFRLTQGDDSVEWGPMAADRFGDLLDKVNEIHAYAPTAPKGPELRINWRNLSAERAGGLYNPGPRALEVSTAESGSYADFAFLHELGHSMDHAWGQVGRWDATAWMTRGANLSKWTPEQLKAWKAFNAAAAKSHMISELRSAFARGNGIRMNGQSWDQDMVAYLLDKREVWARAYSQWIAPKVGTVDARSAARAMRASPYQWKEDDFKELGKAVEGVLKAMGLM